MTRKVKPYNVGEMAAPSRWRIKFSVDRSLVTAIFKGEGGASKEAHFES